MHVICHTVLPGHFPPQLESINNPFRVERVSDLAYELCYCVDATVNQILTKPGLFVQLHYDCFPCKFQTAFNHNKQ